MKKIYEIKDRQTGEIIEDFWENVRDLDKRIWEIIDEKEPKPIARVQVLGGWKEIWSHQDLVGLHVGGYTWSAI